MLVVNIPHLVEESEPAINLVLLNSRELPFPQAEGGSRRCTHHKRISLQSKTTQTTTSL